MKTKNYLIIASLVLSVILITGCQKKNNNNQPVTELNGPAKLVAMLADQKNLKKFSSPD